MDARFGEPAAGEPASRRLFVYTGGLLRPGRVRRILTLAGHRVQTGLPGPQDQIGVWGRSAFAQRGEWVAARRHTPILRIEDALLRSLRPGRSGEPPLGLLLDTRGVYYDASHPSDLEHLLASHPLDDTALLDRARDGIARLIASDLSKYNLHDAALPVPAPGYVLVIDQVRGDASIGYGGATEGTFREMLVFAQAEHPGARIVIKSHPETTQGLRPGHFGPDQVQGRVSLLSDPVSPWKLLEGAVAVYTVTSQLGFEAVLLGHRPRVFGQPFYGGWGLTADENPAPRRRRTLTRAQLFGAAMLLYPKWYDPCRDRLCSFEQVLDHLEAQVRALREDRHGHVALGMRLWKRGILQQVFGSEHRLRFADDPVRATALARRQGRSLLVWAGKESPGLAHSGLPVLRIEDGFLRSRGLGARLVPPLSLVTDASGIYYDPTRQSHLERLIAGPVPPGGARRAERLAATILAAGLSKYNLAAAALPVLPPGHRILVPGQVEDDASIRLGAGEVKTNRALLARVRAENPGAVILYKPHPDVEAGLRPGAVPDPEVLHWADHVLHDADPVGLIDAADEVWTMTSLLGFEALLRQKPVTTLGTPFYAGWGLTRDLGPVPARRQARPTLAALIHATLIAYPRYRDPVTGLPCSPEVVAERLALGQVPLPGRCNRSLSKLQGLFASQSTWWR